MGGRGVDVFIGVSCASSGRVLEGARPDLNRGAGRDLSGGACVVAASLRRASCRVGCALAMTCRGHGRGGVLVALAPGSTHVSGGVGTLALIRRCRWFRCSVVKYLCHSVPVPIFGPFVRGDGLNIRRWRCRRQAGGAKNLDRYRCVTLRRQEKTPRPARMQIRGSWITSTQQRRHSHRMTADAIFFFTSDDACA